MFWFPSISWAVLFHAWFCLGNTALLSLQSTPPGPATITLTLISPISANPRHPAPASAFLYSLLCIGGHREHKLSQVSMTLEQRLQLLRWALLAQGLLLCQPHPCHMSPSSSPSTTALLSCASTPGPLHGLLPHPAKRHFLLFFTSLFLNLQVQESLPHSQDALPPHLPTTFPGYPGPFTCTGFTHTRTPLMT